MRTLLLALIGFALSTAIRLSAEEIPRPVSEAASSAHDSKPSLKKFSITLFRHGQSAYTQGNDAIDLAAAADLCATPRFEGESIESRQARAIEEVRQSTEALARTLDPALPVRILSSPAGRALHTAKVIRSTLSQRGFHVAAIAPDPALGEVGNLEFALMKPLIDGGRFTHRMGSEVYDFLVNKAETNPDNLVHPEYFMADAAHKIPASAMRDWPDSYVKRLKSFETFAAVKQRALDRIRACAKMPDGHVVLVSHSALSLYFSDRYTRGRQTGLAPATFLSIDRTEDGRLVLTRVGEITDGDAETDFITNPE